METVHKYRAAPPARARIAALLVPVALASGRLVHAQDALIIEGDKVTVNANLVVTGSITAPGLADVLAQLQALTDRLQSAEQVAVPVGSIMPYGGGKETAAQLEKNGWLFCDGRTVDRATYSELFAAIGIAFGSPTPDNRSFSLPDLRGRLVRGVDDGFGRDPDAANRVSSAPQGNKGNMVGSVQDDAFQSHVHSGGGGQLCNQCAAGWAHNIVRAVDNTGPPASGRVAQETRPKNVYVNWIIKARSN
jgi:hypothetical protein